MPLHICVLKSSSHANCTALWSKNGAILIDCGHIKLKDFKEQLRAIKLAPDRIQGILISHGHGDHIDRDTFKISHEYKIPIYVHKKTFRTIGGNDSFEGPKYLIKYHTDRMFSISNFKVKPFKTYHDQHHKGKVGMPFGFCILGKCRGKNHKIGYVTDTNVVSEDMIEMLSNCSCLVIESNYSSENIKRDYGWRDHLSNEAAANAIKRIIKSSTNKNILQHVFLAHISQENNSWRYVKKEVFRTLKKEKSMPKKLIRTYGDQKTRIYTIA